MTLLTSLQQIRDEIDPVLDWLARLAENARVQDEPASGYNPSGDSKPLRTAAERASRLIQNVAALLSQIEAQEKEPPPTACGFPNSKCKLGFEADPSNHHNALTCPHCNPKGLQLADPSSGWRSIETAPKDGTEVLLWDGESVSFGGWISEVDQGAEYEGQGLVSACWWSVGLQNNQPTHWQPLPPPPSVPTGGGEIRRNEKEQEDDTRVDRQR